MLEWILSQSLGQESFHMCIIAVLNFLNFPEMPQTSFDYQRNFFFQRIFGHVVWNNTANFQEQACSNSSNDVYHAVSKLSTYL